MAVTIHDVARLAGVHASTVSRVINQSANITAATKAKVRAAMSELDFHPNHIARSLANGTAGAIGLVLDAGEERAFHNQFFASSQFAIQRVAQAHGCHVLVVNGGTPSSNVAASLLLERKVDGLILPPSDANMALLTGIDARLYVLLGQPAKSAPGVSWVDIDNKEGAAIAVRHLIERGCARIAYLGAEAGARGTDFIARRVRGYESALPPGARARVIHTDGTPANAMRAALDALADVNPPDAFVCNDNVNAFGLLQAARARGLALPEDIAVVTLNNYPLAEYMSPPLTAIHIDTGLLGERTAEQLFSQLETGAGAAQILLTPSLITRGSSARTGVTA